MFLPNPTGTSIAHLGNRPTTLLRTEMQMAYAQNDPNVQARIRAEYHEMPGMRLTTAQAARLFNMEPVS